MIRSADSRLRHRDIDENPTTALTNQKGDLQPQLPLVYLLLVCRFLDYLRLEQVPHL